MASKRKSISYSETDMIAAVESVRGGLSKHAAAKLHNVPRSTLIDKVTGRTPIQRRMGRKPYLTEAEELSIVEWMRRSAARGFPPHLREVLDTAQNIVKANNRPNPFTDGRPGRLWFKAFQRRHNFIEVRPEKKGPPSKAESVTPDQEAEIRDWFSKLRDKMTEMGTLDLFEDPSRVFNIDETSIQLYPTTGVEFDIKVEEGTEEEQSGPERSTLTFVGTFSANGDIVSPTIIYPYKRLPQHVAERVPEDFHIGLSDNGWMQSHNFQDYIAKAFIPWINKKQIAKPVILFVDGNSSNITLQICELCDASGVFLYLLPPNSTHILQPVDLGPFKLLRRFWKQEVKNFQLENSNTTVRDVHVAPLLAKVLKRITKASIVNGFRATGLFPLNDRVRSNTRTTPAPAENNDSTGDPTTIGCTAMECQIALDVIQKTLGPEKFKSLQSGELSEDLQMLYRTISEKAQETIFPLLGTGKLTRSKSSSASVTLPTTSSQPNQSSVKASASESSPEPPPRKSPDHHLLVE